MRQISIDEKLYDYILQTSVTEHACLQELRQKTATIPLAHMQISPLQGQFLKFLIQLSGAKHVLELGTFTGYSALAMALAIPADGTVTTCDINTDSTEIAEQYWKMAQVDSKIKLHIGQALDTLQQFIDATDKKYFDFVFIDADKTNYLKYYQLALKLLNSGGIIAIDNVLWHGQVVNEAENGRQVAAIRELNSYISQDNSVQRVMLPLDDGLFLVRKN